MAPAFFAIFFATASSMLTVSFLEDSQSSRMPLVLLDFGCIKWGQSKESRPSKAAGAKTYPNAEMAKRKSQLVHLVEA